MDEKTSKLGSAKTPEGAPKVISSLDVMPKARAKAYLRSLIKPAILALVSSALLVGVIALYAWGADVSAQSSDTGNLATAWAYLLPLAAGLLGLVVAVGLPVWWAYKKGVSAVVLVLALEALILMVTLGISGYFIFSGTNATGGQTNPTPVGCGCNSGPAQYCIQCNSVTQ